MLGRGAFLVALLVCLLIVHFLKVLHSRRRYPPGPLPLPFIGSLWRSGFSVNEHTFRKLANQYGNICTVWIGNIPAVVLCGFEAVKEGLIKHSKEMSDRMQTPMSKAAFKERGITFSNGHIWKQQRRFGEVTMRKLGLGKKGMEYNIEDEAQQLVETLARAKGKPLDPSIPISNSVCNGISALVFGHRFPVDHEGFVKLMEVIAVLMKFAAKPAHVLYELFPWLLRHLPGPHQRALSAREAIASFAKKEIEKHKENDCLHEPLDFIDFYLLQMEKSKNDPNSTYEEDNLAQCIVDLFGAGTETTSTSLKWALLLMTAHPDIQDKVHKEMEDAFGSSHSVSYQDRKKLPYTNAVIHEIQRFKYVLLFGVPRQCAKDVNMLGYFIPKGTIILPDLRSVLLDPKQWETPEEFNPNHFLNKEGHFVAREEFLVFSAGHRSCLGELLARMELFIFFTTLLRAFKFQLPEGVKELSEESVQAISSCPHPYKICCVPRCNEPSTI